MQKHESYKDSSADWLKRIPANWSENKIKNLIISHQGGAWGNEPVGDERDVICVRVADFRFEQLNIYSDDYTLRNYTKEQIEKLLLQYGDILIEKSGGGELNPVGRAVVFNKTFPALYANFLARIRPNHKINPFFLGYLLAACYYIGVNRKYFNQTTGIQNLNVGKYLNETVPYPLLEEQQSIVDYLDRKTAHIDSIIADKEKLIELLREKRQAIISEAVTKGLDPSVPMKDSGIEWLGQIPVHWKMSRIGFEAWVRARLGWKGLKAEEYVDKGFAFLSTPNIKGRDIDFNNVNYITQERYDESPEIKLQVGDVLLAKDGSTLGTVNVIRELPCEATVNSSIAVITPRDNINGVFLKYLFESGYLRNLIQMKKDGMGVPHLFQADIVKFSIPVAPIEEQGVIAEYLDEKTVRIATQIANSEQQIELLKEYRQSIISEAVTGKIMVAAPQRGAESEQVKAKSGGANIHFKRRVLAAKILDKLCGEPTLGHVKLEKLLFLSEYCAQLEMHTEYGRHAAGPYNPQVLRSIDTQLQKAKWFAYNKNNRGSKYTRLAKSTDYAPYFVANFSEEQNASVDRIVELLRSWDTERCEIVATLYGAWNDFLIDGRSPSDDQIVDEVLTHWSDEKKRIDKERWLKALDWMRENQIVPCGYGEKTKRRGS